jgi:Tfp pilus assembly protein FimV
MSDDRVRQIVAAFRKQLRNLQHTIDAKNAELERLRRELQAEQTARRCAEVGRDTALRVVARAN